MTTNITLDISSEPTSQTDGIANIVLNYNMGELVPDDMDGKRK
jgi:hypothetical protein